MVIYFFPSTTPTTVIPESFTFQNENKVAKTSDIWHDSAHQKCNFSFTPAKQQHQPTSAEQTQPGISAIDYYDKLS